MSHRVSSALVAAVFACGSAYTLWRLEWFDVWRHGVPGASQLLIYACYSAAFGAIGWILARIILLNAVEARTGPRRHPSR